ncbi:phosphatidylserine decarboxylase [Ectobacillus sp. sgz5001026]|uniref:phosphatidylserine decarboxylase n=1 Tax=Ectobacillus sp. sgz5001026 TaxID=3242473 RepID=UPI0036D37D9B
MLQALYRLFIELTNGRFTSYLLRKFSQSSLSSFVIPSYARTYHINQEEMEKDLHSYGTLHELFTRRLKDGMRQIDVSPHTIVSPVDGVLEDYGCITKDRDFIIKGKHYSVREMLGNEERAQRYKDGTFFVLYLSPSHYHRIHSPLSGQVLERYSLGKKSYPVNRLGMKYGKEPLSKNYRMITEISCEGKQAAIVKVGAMFVNSIELLHEHDFLRKGEEMAYFTFGSTVVLLFEKGMVNATSSIQKGQAVVVGQIIAQVL